MKPIPYLLADGVRVPSVTTIIGACKLGSIDGLLAWANREGAAGRSFEESREAAADAGRCAHDRVYCYTHGRTFDESKWAPDTLARSEAPYQAFLEWAQQSNLTVAAGEVRIVSETMRFGGTLDAITVGDKLAVADWKTAASVRVEYLIQIAAYGKLWEGAHPDMPLVGGYHIVRFSKPAHPDDPVHFAHHHWAHLDPAWVAFKHMRELYELNKRLGKMI
ncbi:MAG: hypothetical protein ACREDG_00145 [Methylocella sp.]